MALQRLLSTYLGRTLSVDLAEHNIHVSIVHPGFVETPLTERNSFAMPMIISSEAATQRIVNGIAFKERARSISQDDSY